MRLFVALPLPEETRTRLSLLAGGIPGARWVAPDQLHLTLAFIGEVDGLVAEDGAAALSLVHARPFDLALAGVGEFGRGERSRTLWADVAPQPALHDLRDRIVAALGRARVPYDNRKFTPHVTVARLTQVAEARVAAFLQSHALFRAPAFPVTGFGLYSSWTGGEGSIYREEVWFPFESDGRES